MALTITDVVLPGGTRSSVRVVDGVVTAIGGEPQPGDERLDGNGRLVLPAMAEAHAHLDKAFLSERVPNPTGDLMGAIYGMQAARDTITADDILPLGTRTASETDRLISITLLKDARAEFERMFIEHKLRECGNNISKTADFIGVERSNLHRKIKGLNIDLG